MKLINFTILVILLLSNTCFGQHRQRLELNDLTKLNLNGMVKSLIHTDYNPTKLEDTVNITIDHFILAPNNYKSEFN